MFELFCGCEEMQDRAPLVSDETECSGCSRRRSANPSRFDCVVRFLEQGVRAVFSESLLKTTAVLQFLNTRDELLWIDFFFETDSNIAAGRTFDRFVEVSERHRLLVMGDSVVRCLRVDI